MEINWLGHSCFRLKGSRATVITDPYSQDIGYSLGKVTANVVTVSHQHPGHSDVSQIGGEPKAVTGPGEYEISGVLIIGMPSYHDENRGEKRGKNTIYLMEFDEITICHLGDLGHSLSTNQAEELDNVDILLLPVGGFYTIDAKVATEVCNQLKPRVIIPMHYKTEKGLAGISGVEGFLSGKASVSRPDSSQAEFKPGELPATVQIIVLKPAL